MFWSWLRDSRLVFPSNYNGTVQGLAGVEEGAALAPRRSSISPSTFVSSRRSSSVSRRPRIITLAWHKGRYRSPANKAFVEPLCMSAGIMRSGLRYVARLFDHQI